MGDLTQLTRDELSALNSDLAEAYAACQKQGLELDMTRGKPSPEQLDLCNSMLSLPGADTFRNSGGVDCRNYGVLDGLPDAKTLFAAYMDVPPNQLIIGGNSSLTLMHDMVVQALLHGTPDGEHPWCKLPSIKFICPVPGYDRHFSVCQTFGIEMVTVPMTGNGPDMDAVEKLVSNDASIKGMWCVPKYSNPTGETYSDAVVDRLAAMKTAATDFRIFWDNAYHVHTLTDRIAPLKNMVNACRDAGNPNRAIAFGSTSKISFAGSGVALLASSQENIDAAKHFLSKQTIGSDKLNQLRHVLFFGKMAGIEAHMQKHAAILKPKFDAVDEILTNQLGAKNIATWSRPQGGYFVSLDTRAGCAQDVVTMAGEAGVKLTKAGATFPLGQDPNDRNIRLAPSLPSLSEIRQATEVVALCVQRVSVAQLLADKP